MSHVLRVGVADQIAYFRAYNTDGSAKTDLTSATTGLTLSVFRVGASSVSISSLSDKAADDSTHADGAIRAVGGNLYTIDIPDAATATQVPSVVVRGSYTGGVVEGLEHPIVAYNPSVVAVGANTTTPPTVGAIKTEIETTTVLAKQNTLTTGVNDILTAVGNIEVDNAAIADAVWEKDISGSTGSTAGAYIKDVWGRVTASVYTMWTNLVAMISGSGASAQWTEKALELGSSNVAVYPTQLQQEDRNVEGPIKIYTGETGQQFFFVLDSNLQPVDLTGKNLELRFADSGAKKTLYTAKTSNATISVSLTNKVTFTKSVDFTRFEMSTLRFSLRDMGAGGEVILTGPVKLIWAP